MATSSHQLLEVAIVGAGPAGLVSAKSLLELGITNIAVFDETSSPGGVWNKEARQKIICHLKASRKNDDVDQDPPREVETSPQPMYENLKANFAKDVSNFLGYPYDASVEFFPAPEAFSKYYRGYVKNYGLETVIHYHSRVVECRKVASCDIYDGEPKHQDDDDDASSAVWKIRVMDPRSTVTREFTSKRLLVCNGHFTKASCPDIPGMEYFCGKRLLHSSAFTSPKDLVDDRDSDGGPLPTILVVGAFASGSEIATMLARFGKYKRLVISMRTWKTAHNVLFKPLLKENHRDVILRPEIDRMDTEGNVHFRTLPKTGKLQEYVRKDLPEMEKPDIIVFATGYRYHFPFLSGDFVREGGFKMTNLYKRILYAKDHSLAFIGITNRNLSPSIVQEYQARWYAQVVVREECSRFRSKVAQKEMQQEIQDRERVDSTQDELMFKFPAYCNSLASDIGIRGYFMQLLLDRLPLHLRSLWVRKHPSIYWLFGVTGIVPALLLAAFYAL